VKGVMQFLIRWITRVESLVLEHQSVDTPAIL